MKTIARTLNEQRRKTPALMQLELLNKSLPNTQDVILKKYLWDATMIARILRDESYVGTLICHKANGTKSTKLSASQSRKNSSVMKTISRRSSRRSCGSIRR